MLLRSTMKQKSEATDENVYVQQTTVVGIEPVKLKQIYVASVAQFIRKRKHYEEQIAQNNKDGLKINPMSLKMSLTENVLETMLE